MKLLHDIWLLFSWNIRATLRSPVWALIGLFQPLCYLFLFGPLLQPLTNLGEFPPGGAQTVFVPGVMIMMSIFNTAFVGFGLIGELRAGFLERLRITPLSRLALPLGRVLHDIVLLLIQSLLLIGIALPLGAHVDLVGLVFLCGLLALLGLCLSSCSYGLALTFKDENALSSVLNTFNLPLFLLSGITLPLTLAPPLLRTLGNLNPLTHAVNAARALFVGNLMNEAVAKGFIIVGILALAALFWAFRAFQRATA